jgi:hypothetical protein
MNKIAFVTQTQNQQTLLHPVKNIWCKLLEYKIILSTYERVIFVTTSNIGDKTAGSNFQSIILTFNEHSSTERGSIVDKSSVDYFYAPNSTS